MIINGENEFIDCIRAFADEHNLLWGVSDAEPLGDVCALLRHLPHTPFTPRSPEQRTDPGKTMQGVRSIIVLGLCCPRGRKEDASDALSGVFSAGALDEDYHAVLTRLLDQLAERLLDLANARFHIHVDTGPLCERAFAEKAGLGFVGRNHQLISPRAGSFFHIGLLLTSLRLPVSKRRTGSCGSCTKCERACPGGALYDGRLDVNRCVSYLTQKKGRLTAEERRVTGRAIYGCDVCRNVCPHNRHVPQTAEVAVPIEALLALTDATFRQRFDQTSAGWRGLEVMKRNARIALENSRQARV